MARIESALQRACVGWFRLQYRHHAQLLFAVPNGGGRSRVEAAIMKGEGVLAGVADLIFLEARGGYGSLCIEMKTKDGRQSKLQKEWQHIAEAAGNRYIVCRSFDEFKVAIEAYMSLAPSPDVNIDEVEFEPIYIAKGRSIIKYSL